MYMDLEDIPEILRYKKLDLNKKYEFIEYLGKRLSRLFSKINLASSVKSKGHFKCSTR